MTQEQFAEIEFKAEIIREAGIPFAWQDHHRMDDTRYYSWGYMDQDNEQVTIISSFLSFEELCKGVDFLVRISKINRSPSDERSVATDEK